MKTAVVTGGAAGIGAEIVRLLAENGYRVGILDVDPQAVATACAPYPNAVAMPADVTDEAAVAAAFDRLEGAPDLVVNNAGIVRFGKLADQTVADFRKVIEINLVGVYIVTREAVRRMAPRGSGHVIGLTSINAYGPGPGSGAYPAAKCGVKQLIKQFALEYGDQGLRFNSIAPGFIVGGMSAPIYADPKVRAARSAGVPLGRLGTPADIANAVLFLDGEGAGYITGHDLVIDGGVSHAVLRNLPRE
ncbi:SDR family NAD(P)-dependent oxidoreductase [Sphingosinicella microcystinivorans]|uniref:NAD(P)-dependent dehydrogenase (Short-subunit alcohol dehydrogenase family) n=1 Tax=Sphingosinicella microcystinivorans TaxID=335406 RepID=A0AAD1G258_SPHMI|nr:SDR family NAD(P)-dependent oxidoreductase [Sphingosinicella microcystinivorans]RKS86303.1 NAD(P)-dependent dehydrogenase (short-subunit alcohol dehydrogenase family) [Sphingosinicella microcystinivorans]BBE35652.1 oxidoreductase [Sphingosinicella microcystinivorans]